MEALERPAPPSERSRVVVVGNGMVGHRFCERLAALDPDRRLAVTVFGDEKRAAYDRVQLSEFFAGKSAADLAIADPEWYGSRSYALHLAEGIRRIDRTNAEVVSAGGRRVAYDHLVLATGSAPFVPPIPGIVTEGVFVYRTIEDLEAIRDWAGRASSAAVIGGGLLGLEAAKAALDMGLETHVVEFAERLMPRQLDATGGAFLRKAIAKLGVHVHLAARTEEVVGEEFVRGLRFADGTTLDVDLVIVSAGIRPRDELARSAGLGVGERGGVEVDDHLTTNDPRIHAIGEVALHRGMIYGLVAPGYVMADVLARRLTGANAEFTGAELSAKLKLLGVDVACFGDYFADEERPDETRTVVYEDAVRGVYQKLVTDNEETRLLGGILVGDTERYLPLHAAAREGRPLPERSYEMLFGAPADRAHMPAVDPALGARIARGVAVLISAGHVRAAHDCSDGGLLVAAAEMAMAGRLGLDLTLHGLDCFSEEPSRYLLEIAPDALAHLGVPHTVIGTFNDTARLTLADDQLNIPIDDLLAAWLGTLDW